MRMRARSELGQSEMRSRELPHHSLSRALSLMADASTDELPRISVDTLDDWKRVQASFDSALETALAAVLAQASDKDALRQHMQAVRTFDEIHVQRTESRPLRSGAMLRSKPSNLTCASMATTSRVTKPSLPQSHLTRRLIETSGRLMQSGLRGTRL